MTSANTRAIISARVTFLVIGLLAILAEDAHPGQPMQEKEYEYREDLSRVVTIRREEGWYFGHLDSQGNFTPLAGEKPHGAYFGPAKTIINKPWTKDEAVFEFRSGALIKGKLDMKGNFVPDVGSTVISFNDYRYSKDAPRIYNLPGKFVEKTDKKPKP